MERQAIKLAKALAGMQEEGTLCDVTLQAEQKKLQAHKIVLAAGSPYFMAMFNGNFRETESKVVTFQEVTFSGLKAVVDDIYSKTVDVPVESIPDVVPAAHLFQMENLLYSMCRLMTDNISSDNCFQFLEIAQKYQLEWVVDEIHQFIVDNFTKVAANKEFYHTPKEEFCRYLSSDYLCTKCQEIEVYKAAKIWLGVNKVKDSKTVVDVMRTVRFVLIKPESLSEIMYDDVLYENGECRTMVENAMKYQTNVTTQPLHLVNHDKPRGMKGLIIFPTETPDKADIHLIPFSKPGQSKPVPSPFPENSWMSVVNVNNFLFVFGVERNTYQHFTKRYDAATDHWLDMMPLQRQPTVRWATAHDGQSIFLIGGAVLIPGTDRERSVSDTYKFSISNNNWVRCENLPVDNNEPSATHLNGYIYSCGGAVDIPRGSKSLFAFDIKEGKWLVKGSLQRFRWNPVLEAVGDKLYVIGGYAMQTNKTAIEVYNPNANQWTFVRSVFDSEYQCHGATSFVCDDKIYVVGGYDKGMILEFDIKKRKLTETQHRLPGDSFSYACALMTLPKLL